MLCANATRSAEPRKLSGIAQVDLPDHEHVGVRHEGVVGHARRHPVTAAEQLEDPGLVGVGEAEAAGGAGAEALGRGHLRRADRRPRGGAALLQDQVPQLTAVALVDVRIGGQDGRVETGEGAVVHAQLALVDAALLDPALGEDLDEAVLGRVRRRDDLQVRVVGGRPVVVVAHHHGAVGRGVLAGEHEVAPVLRQRRPGRRAARAPAGSRPRSPRCRRRGDRQHQTEPQNDEQQLLHGLLHVSCGLAASRARVRASVDPSSPSPLPATPREGHCPTRDARRRAWCRRAPAAGAGASTWSLDENIDRNPDGL